VARRPGGHNARDQEERLEARLSNEEEARRREVSAEYSSRTSRSTIMVAASYEIHIKGRISEQLLSAFEGLEATVEPVETVLSGRELDQAALRGVLDRIQGLGLELIEVRRLPGSAERSER
jgi:hypothetical protein